MTTEKENSAETCLGTPRELKKTLEVSSGEVQELPRSESTLSSPIPKTKRIMTRLITSISGTVKNNSSDTYQEKRKVKENKRGTKSRQKSRVWDMRKKSRTKQQSSNFKRRLWTTEEDKAITLLVEQYGIRKWTLISRKLQEKHHIYGRSGKQCRER